MPTEKAAAPAPVLKCPEKHTKYQPTDAEWRCPGCGSDHEHFYIDGPVSDSSMDCGKLHEQDGLYCFSCQDGLSGKAFAARLAKQNNLVPCPKCKGHGLVPGPAQAPAKKAK